MRWRSAPPVRPSSLSATERCDVGRGGCTCVRWEVLRWGVLCEVGRGECEIVRGGWSVYMCEVGRILGVRYYGW